MVKLRLRRRGRKRLPVYDIVAADSRSPRDGRYIERIGQYNPLITNGATMLDRSRAVYWVKTGAEPSDTVRDILSREGVLLAIDMERKGASHEEISTAVAAHVMRNKQQEENAEKIKQEKEAAKKKEREETEKAAAEAKAAEEAAAAAEAEKAEAESTDADSADESAEEAPAEAVAEESSEEKSAE